MPASPKSTKIPRTMDQPNAEMYNPQMQSAVKMENVMESCNTSKNSAIFTFNPNPHDQMQLQATQQEQQRQSVEYQKKAYAAAMAASTQGDHRLGGAQSPMDGSAGDGVYNNNNVNNKGKLVAISFTNQNHHHHVDHQIITSTISTSTTSCITNTPTNTTNSSSTKHVTDDSIVYETIVIEHNNNNHQTEMCAVNKGGQAGYVVLTPASFSELIANTNLATAGDVCGAKDANRGKMVGNVGGSDSNNKKPQIPSQQILMINPSTIATVSTSASSSNPPPVVSQKPIMLALSGNQQVGSD